MLSVLLLSLLLAGSVKMVASRPPPQPACPARCRCHSVGEAAIDCPDITIPDWNLLAAINLPPWSSLTVTFATPLPSAERLANLADLGPGWRHGKLRRLRLMAQNPADIAELLSRRGQVWPALMELGLSCPSSSGTTVGRELPLANLSVALPNLAELNASACGLAGVSTNFGRLANLRRLDLSGNPLSDLHSLLERLANVTGAGLRELRLSASGRLATRGLASHPNLRLVEFADSPNLTGVDYEFVDSLRRLPRLRQLRFVRCPRLADLSWGPELRRIGLDIGQGGSSWNCSACGVAWLSSETAVCSEPARLRGRRLSSLNFTAELGCRPPRLLNFSGRASYGIGDSARLLCRVAAEPPAHVTWVTGRGVNITYRPPHRSRYYAPADTFTNTFHAEHQWHWNTQYEDRKAAEGPGSSRVQVLQDGSLYIDYVTRADAGLYRCIVDNGIGPPIVRELVFTLKYEVLREVKKYGMMVGALCAASLLCIAGSIGLIRLAVRKCSEKERRRQKSIKEMLEHLEAYRGAKMGQLRECKDWLRTYRHNQMDNCNARVGKVKEACVGNMMVMQEHYNRRIAKIRDHCDCQIERLRESYNSQMSRIKDYKSNQVERVRDQYNQQLLRIKEYAGTQLERLRDQYKAQQTYLLKVLDSVSIDNCVSGEAAEEQLMNFRLDITPDASDSEDAVIAGTGFDLILPLPSVQTAGGDCDEDVEDFVTAIGDDGDSRLDLSDDQDDDDNDDDSGVSSQRIVVEAEVLPPPPPPPPLPETQPLPPRTVFSTSLPDLPASASSAGLAVEL